MKKFITLFVVLITSISFSQTTYPDTVRIPFFEDYVEVYPNESPNPAKYMFTMDTVLSNIEKNGQAYLDLLGKQQLWLVPKSLSMQVETILKKHGLVVKYKREGY